MINVFNSYIPKFIVNLPQKNNDIIYVSSSYLSADGDVYVLENRLVSPILTQTTQSLQELQPEISTTYPFKIVTPIDIDGSTIILSPSITSEPTASQGYYVPIYFERYNADFIRNIDKSFSELVVNTEEQNTQDETGTTPENTNNTSNPTPSPTPTPSPSMSSNRSEGSTSSGGSTGGSNDIVTVRITEEWANMQRDAQSDQTREYILENGVGIPTTGGGWVWVHKNNSTTINNYRTGILTGLETAAAGGVILLLRPRREYYNQLSAADRLLIVP